MFGRSASEKSGYICCIRSSVSLASLKVVYCCSA